MCNYFRCIFHIVIISLFLGCGYKAPPTWDNKKSEINATDLKIFDINATLKIKMGVK
ncbi:hypothetical protein JCM11957_04650 [Caminibacter profundus]